MTFLTMSCEVASAMGGDIGAQTKTAPAALPGPLPSIRTFAPLSPYSG